MPRIDSCAMAVAFHEDQGCVEHREVVIIKLILEARVSLPHDRVAWIRVYRNGAAIDSSWENGPVTGG